MQKDFIEKQEFEKMNDIQEILQDKRVSHQRKSKEMQGYVDVINSSNQSPNVSPKF